jgi:glycosyltransferase involved in cell wall biosynthesis
MKLAIIHYHLNRGGVTRVIENQLCALDVAAGARRIPLDKGAKVAVALVYGGRAESRAVRSDCGFANLTVRPVPIPLVDYDSVQTRPPSPNELAQAISDSLRVNGFLPEETILHVHNHALGKNAALPEAVARLAEAGWRLLLQIHDFVEDFRPANFRILRAHLGTSREASLSWHGRLYPQASQIHYAVLTSGAAQVLLAAGVAESRVHYLPNPIDAAVMPASRQTRPATRSDAVKAGRRRQYWLYPVRAIRRKNVGEAVLLAALGAGLLEVGITLPATSATELPSYRFWKQFAEERNVACQFDVAVEGGASFARHLAACDRVLTTSLAEGFGLGFLEAWLNGRELVGRDLPEVTADFVAVNIHLDKVYGRLLIPSKWLNVGMFRELLRTAYWETIGTYGIDPVANWLDRLEQKAEGAAIDFGDLDELDQAQVIDQLLSRSEAKEELLGLNPSLQKAISAPTSPEVIRDNEEKIRRHFGLETTGKRLADIYCQLLKEPASEPPEPLANSRQILELLLRPERFRLIRSNLLRVS